MIAPTFKLSASSYTATCSCFLRTLLLLDIFDFHCILNCYCCWLNPQHKRRQKSYVCSVLRIQLNLTILVFSCLSIILLQSMICLRIFNLVCCTDLNLIYVSLFPQWLMDTIIQIEVLPPFKPNHCNLKHTCDWSLLFKAWKCV